MYVPGEEEYVKAWMGPLEPRSCVRGVEGNAEEDVEFIVGLNGIAQSTSWHCC